MAGLRTETYTSAHLRPHPRAVPWRPARRRTMATCWLSSSHGRTFPFLLVWSDQEPWPGPRGRRSSRPLLRLRFHSTPWRVTNSLRLHTSTSSCSGALMAARWPRAGGGHGFEHIDDELCIQ
ncbi:hypothetical protein SORBI_3009G122350 [Sorghum bicolor]|uniref:Uncharacterized protein n=1 Tax=Sorghum bicolor TaxID=4558 RepID=A0A1Z5R392_SORBI|nr:hypothetical protein SORBI_3009G122350 [Sorghum bicolor]